MYRSSELATRAGAPRERAVHRRWRQRQRGRVSLVHREDSIPQASTTWRRSETRMV